VRGQQRLSIDTGGMSSKEPEHSSGLDHHGIDVMVGSEATEDRQSRRKSGAAHRRTPSPALQTTLLRTSLPSYEVAIFLIEIYFSRVYNANLLFHKRSFLSDLAVNRVPGFVALSVFALASMYVFCAPRPSQIMRLKSLQLFAPIEMSSW
jgi:hypothetical protein